MEQTIEFRFFSARLYFISAMITILALVAITLRIDDDILRYDVIVMAFVLFMLAANFIAGNRSGKIIFKDTHALIITGREYRVDYEHIVGSKTTGNFRPGFVYNYSIKCENFAPHKNITVKFNKKDYETIQTIDTKLMELVAHAKQ